MEAFEHEGLPCRTVLTSRGHWCGYVGVPDDHPWHGRHYNDKVDVPKEVITRKNYEVGIINLFCADLSDYKETGKAELSLAVDVHGGLTFSAETSGDGSQDGATWWLGFDCAHFNDDPSIHDGDYTAAQCRRLAEQIAKAARRGD